MQYCSLQHQTLLLSRHIHKWALGCITMYKASGADRIPAELFQILKKMMLLKSCMQYLIGTWNVRSMNQGKLEVVKQQIARVNVDILGISELKWTGMSEFNSADHYIYYCGQESLRRNGVAIMVNKRVQDSTWMQSQKRQNDLCLFPRQTIQYHSNPSLGPNH